VTAKAYAIIDGRGRLLLDTVRAEEHVAREAAVKLRKTLGVGWRDLERDGHRVVLVEVTMVQPQSKSTRKPADLVVAAARERLESAAADSPDHRPIRRLLKRRTST
jgi:hypothetical protein